MKVYTLELQGEVQCTGVSSLTFETTGVSTDRAKLEALKVQKDAELDDYLEDQDKDDEDGYTLYNTDLGDRPEWVIVEHEML